MQEIVNAVVIDNDANDIMGISTALASAGISTLPVHFKDATLARAHCKKTASASPRIIITDIQMQESGREPSKTDLGNVAGCLAEIVSNTDGPYIVLAWTAKPEALNDLKEVVQKFFEKRAIREPFYFDGISKAQCKGEDGYEASLILESFAKHIEDMSEF